MSVILKRKKTVEGEDYYMHDFDPFYAYSKPPIVLGEFTSKKEAYNAIKADMQKLEEEVNKKDNAFSHWCVGKKTSTTYVEEGWGMQWSETVTYIYSLEE